MGNKLQNAVGHFRTITKHKFTVMGLCFRIGLIRQGLLHDNSKYTPVEFRTGVRYYQGNKSPNAVEKREKGYSDAWLHHKGRNKHHFEYWLDLSYQPGEGVVGAKMPLKYVLEMACDRIAACKIYHGSSYTDRDPWEYYSAKNSCVHVCLHKDTRAMLEKILQMLAEEGEEKTIRYMRWLIRNPQIYEDGSISSGRA